MLNFCLHRRFVLSSRLISWFWVKLVRVPHHQQLVSMTFQEKASEILSVICEGFSVHCEKSRLHHEDILEASKDSTPSPPSSSSSSIAAKPVKPISEKPVPAQSRFRSDQLVSRMKQFFQGTSSTDRSTLGGSRRSQSPNGQDARR